MLKPVTLAVFTILISISFIRADEPAFTPAADTQNANDRPPTPEESLAKITVPEGFTVKLYAAEPDVRQPIDMKFDPRGRLWVAESYSYDGHHFVENVADRILIFEDSDHNGEFDKRSVFWDMANRLTSLEFAPGGLYVLNAGELQFLPDADRDDVMDGPPVTLLDGFDTYEIGHNIVSGIIWGPDGWIYGRHGIKATSRPGPPEVPLADREPINVGIWRYHPQRAKFEVVTHGTTNPWGLDFNEVGELFFTNNVIGHLWHVIPGAHFVRMYGEDFNPHLYELIDQHADHYHWDHSQNWTDSREAAGVHGQLGGGHSHCGGLIYLGGQFPKEYHGRMLMCNTHGRRLNQDILEREGSGYVGKHGPDFFMANDPWFRGVSIAAGPEGSIYISDWCDFGECHDHDGIHRSSGRIYCLSYGDPSGLPADFDLSQESNAQLILLHYSQNEWHARTARRLLLERQLRGDDIEDAVRSLMRMMIEDANPQMSLRALFTLATLGRIDEEMIAFLISQPNEHHRVWGIKLLAEYFPESRKFDDALLALADGDESGLVRLHLVSALKAFPPAVQWTLLQTMALRESDVDDHNLPLMIWYRMEALITNEPARAIILLDRPIFPMLKRHIARRITSDLDKSPQPVKLVVSSLGRQKEVVSQLEILTGMSQALRGWGKATAPEGWSELAKKLSESESEAVRNLSQELSLVFGDGRAMDELKRLAADGNEPPDARRRALVLLNQSPTPELLALILKLLPDRATTETCLRALAAYDDPNAAKQIIGRYPSLMPEWKPIAVETLAARATSAKLLLEAMRDGKFAVTDLSVDQARQIENLGDPALTKLLQEVWGTLRQTPAEKQQLIGAWKTKLSDEWLKSADLSHGRALYQKNCANCHTLFGQGSKIGPDLTGGNRDNLDYLLGNIVDPSSAVPQTFKVSVILLQDGRVLTGVVGRDDGTTVDIQTTKDKITVRKSEIEEMKASDLSLMPDGLLKDLSDDDVRDLIGYLKSPRQVPLPASAEQTSRPSGN